MQNSMIAPRNMAPILIPLCRIQWCCSFFFCFEWNTLFWQFWSKKSNYHLKLKFGTYTNSKMYNSVVIFTFSVFDRKYTFWTNLIQKVKVISWSWNLVLTLIRTCRIQWWDSLFLSLIGNTRFRQIWSKESKLSFKAEIWYLD